VAFSSLPGSQQLELITLADMNHIVTDVIELAHDQPDKAMSLAVDRLIQILQVALVTGAFRCSLGKSLFTYLLYLFLLTYYCFTAN